MKIDISIILIYYNTPSEIIDCVKSIKYAIENFSYEIIVVDNDSPKAIPQAIKGNALINIIKNRENLGYGKAINQATKVARGDYLFILNPDTVCTKGSISLLVQRIKRDMKIGVIGPQQVDKKGNTLHSIGSMPKLPDALFALSFINKFWPTNPYSKRYWATEVDRGEEQETETVGGAAMLFSKKIFQKIGGFDERFFMYFEEADICYRLKRKGYKILYYPKAKIIHLVGRSTSDKIWIRKTFEKSRYEFFKKYYGMPIAFACELFLRNLNLRRFH